MFNLLSWSSRKAKWPVRSKGAAEILAAGDAIDEVKMLAKTLSHPFDVEVPVFIALVSNDIFTSLSTQRNSIEKCIRADNNVIRSDFERRNGSRFIWVPGRMHLSDPGRKPDKHSHRCAETLGIRRSSITRLSGIRILLFFALTRLIRCPKKRVM